MRGGGRARLGSLGVRAIFARSANLAGARFPFFDAITTEPEQGHGEQLRNRLRGQKETTAAEAAAALYATFLGLLVTFIGEGLTAKALRGAWPELGDAFLTPEGRGDPVGNGEMILKETRK